MKKPKSDIEKLERVIINQDLRIARLYGKIDIMEEILRNLGILKEKKFIGMEVDEV